MKETQPQWSLNFRYVIGILLFAAFVAFVFYAREAIRNFVLAGFVAYLLNPGIEFFASRTRISRTASVNIVFFSSVILLVGLPAALAPVVYDEAQIVVEDLLDLSKQLGDTLSQPVMFGNLVFHLEGPQDGVERPVAGGLCHGIEDLAIAPALLAHLFHIGLGDALGIIDRAHRQFQ